MMRAVLKYKFHILCILFFAGIGYFIPIQSDDHNDLAEDDFICPEEDVDVNFTLAYMSKVDVEGVLSIIDFLQSQGCDIALQKIQARMSADIESGTYPGSRP